MLFSHLLKLPYNQNTLVIDIPSIVSKLPNTPLPVVQQLYADHGRNEDFQELYGNLNIVGLKWELVSYPASKLYTASINPQYCSWYKRVGNRVKLFASEGWNCIDVRCSVVDHWSKCGTWITPPVMLPGKLIGLLSELHLVEGHTRLGLLNGLILHHILSPDSNHYVWLGSDCGY